MLEISSSPSSASLAFISGSRSALLMAALSLSTIARGVPSAPARTAARPTNRSSEFPDSPPRRWSARSAAPGNAWGSSPASANRLAGLDLPLDARDRREANRGFLVDDRIDWQAPRLVVDQLHLQTEQVILNDEVNVLQRAKASGRCVVLCRAPPSRSRRRTSYPSRPRPGG